MTYFEGNWKKNDKNLLFENITYFLGTENLNMAGVLVQDVFAFLRGICLVFRRVDMKFRCIMIRKLRYIFHFLSGTSWIRNERRFRSWYLQSLPLKWCCMCLGLMAYGYIKINLCEGIECCHVAQDEVNWRDFVSKQGISWPSIYPQIP
jgi:hypothetical protein